MAGIVGVVVGITHIGVEDGTVLIMAITGIVLDGEAVVNDQIMWMFQEDPHIPMRNYRKETIHVPMGAIKIQIMQDLRLVGILLGIKIEGLT